MSVSLRLALGASLFALLAFSADAAVQYKIADEAIASLSRPLKADARLKLENVPMLDGEPGTLELEPFEVWASDADIQVLGENGAIVEKIDVPPVRYFRGRVAGESGSIVFLSVDGARVEGIIETETRRFAVGTRRVTINRGRRADAAADAVEIFIEEVPVTEDFPEGGGYRCDVEGHEIRQRPDETIADAALPWAPRGQSDLSASPNTVWALNLAIETDYELYVNAGSSAANVTAFVGNLVGAASTIYRRDLTTELLLTSLTIHSAAADPFAIVPGGTGLWNGASTTYTTSHALAEFGDRWHNSPPSPNPRSSAVLLSGKSQLAGVAWIGTICGNDILCQSGSCTNPLFDGHYGGRYAYCGGIDPPNSLAVPDPNADPNYTAPSSNYWPLLQFTHELGHNVGSGHTHCIALSPADQATYGRQYVDYCVNGCWGGATTVPLEKGTIMSYCHFYGGTSTRFTFGKTGEASYVVPQNLKNNYIRPRTPGLSQITAPASLAAGAGGVASGTNVAGVIYEWTISNGTINGSSTSNSVSFTATANPVIVKVKATNASGCSVTDFKSVAVDETTSYPPPANIVATALTTTSVQITWNAVPDATTYKIYRSHSGGSYNEIGEVTGLLSYTDTTPSANTAYQYTVSAGTSPYFSTFGTPDLATTVIFTDPTLTASSTMVKLAHFNELLTAVNAVRTLATLSPIAFTAPAPATSVTIRRQHLLDLRAGLDAARAGLPASAISYTDPAITAQSTQIKAAHINDLRNGVK